MLYLVLCRACAVPSSINQLGSGKTFTMMGNSENGRPSATQNAGLYVCAAKDIFAMLDRHPSLSVCVSFYEIYGYVWREGCSRSHSHTHTLCPLSPTLDCLYAAPPPLPNPFEYYLPRPCAATV